MKKIIENNYKSILKRGLITPKTTPTNFIMKLYEEVGELNKEVLKLNRYNIPFEDAILISDKNLSLEIADVILTALNFARHFNIDIKNILKEKIEINFKRND